MGKRLAEPFRGLLGCVADADEGEGGLSSDLHNWIRRPPPWRRKHGSAARARVIEPSTLMSVWRSPCSSVGSSADVWRRSPPTEMPVVHFQGSPRGDLEAGMITGIWQRLDIIGCPRPGVFGQRNAHNLTSRRHPV